MAVFWNVAPCSLVEIKCLEVPHFYDNKNKGSDHLDEWCAYEVGLIISTMR
jgi:hypothetical protein